MVLHMFGMMPVRIVLGLVDGYGSPFLHPDRNVEQNDGGLENGHTDQFLDQVVFADHGIKPDQQEHDVDAVVEPLDQELMQQAAFSKHNDPSAGLETAFEAPPAR